MYLVPSTHPDLSFQGTIPLNNILYFIAMIDILTSSKQILQQKKPVLNTLTLPRLAHLVLFRKAPGNRKMQMALISF